MYQLLIFTQALVAMLLPSSVIPLFRIASSRPIMGVYKASQVVELLSVITFIGMLGLKIAFVVEMILGNSDWVGNLRWNMGSSMPILYVVLLITVSASFCLMLWLVATPLKSASTQLDTQVWNLDTPKGRDSFAEDIKITDNRYHEEVHAKKQEPSAIMGKTSDSCSDRLVGDFDLDLPETIMEPEYDDFQLSVEQNSSSVTASSSTTCQREESTSLVEMVPVSSVDSEVCDVTLIDKSTVKIESVDPVEKTVGIEDPQIEKDDDDGDTWEPEESSKGVSGSTSSLTSEGPGSFRSLSGKSEEGGNGAGSLSRLAGLGRAARRQLAAVLDEFWGQLYDFHGQATQEAKSKKLDVLLGIESKASSSSLIVDTTTKEVSGYFPSVGGRGPDSLTNSSLYDSPKQQRVQSPLDPSYGVQRSSSMWSNHMQLLDAYVQNSSRHVHDSAERRYSSVRNLSTTEGWDCQPATVHGYQIASYLSRIAKDSNVDNLNGQLDSRALKSPSFGGTNYRDSLAFAMGQKLQNGLSTSQTSSYQNLVASRNSLRQSEQPYYGLCPTGTVENVVNQTSPKKYHSLPDIHRELSVSNKSAQWERPTGFGSSVSRNSYEQPLYSSSGIRTGAPLAFDELSPPKVYREALSSPMKSSFDTGSLWSRQPFEQFGVAHNSRAVDNSRAVGSAGVGSRTSSLNQEAASPADLEAKLLQSFRFCIVKLLKLEGSDWLFRQNDGVDEDLIDRVAAREKFIYEAETREMNWGIHTTDPQYGSSDRKFSAIKNNDANFHFMVSSVPHCGEGCVWKSDLIVSFGVWCIHRILDLSLMESRPELWGKYTYVLNRLQVII